MREIGGVSTLVRVLVHRLITLSAEYNNASKSSTPPPSIVTKLIRVFRAVATVTEEIERTRRDNESLNLWLLHVPDVLFKVNDLIDELQSQVQQPGGISFSLSRWNPFSNEFKLVLQLKLISSLLDRHLLHYSAIRFFSCPDLTSVSRGGATTRPYAYCRPEILGRERDKKVITDTIFNHVAAADRGVLVVAIVGIEGIGKTSLAQLIYNDPGIRSQFEIMLWVNGNGKTNDELFHLIYQMITQARQEDHSPREMKLKLSELLKEKRFFLVVDDAWSESSSYNSCVDVFDLCSKSSVVLVTTHLSRVADAFMASMVHHITLLEDEVGYQLFASYAFASSSLQIQPKLQYFAREILLYCRGMPLYLKILGKHLSNDDNQQRRIEFLLKLEVYYNESNDIHPILRIVNDELPSYLKLPFCTLHLLTIFSVEELIYLWMALGFMYSDDPNQQPEYVGRKYLRELSESAICPDVEYAPGGVVTDIKLHDLLNDLATEVARKLGFRSLRKDKSSSDIDDTVKYLILEEDCLAESEVLVKLRDMKKLQLFILCPGEESLAQSFMNVLPIFKSLRVLGVGGCDIENLPDSIGQLKHLRYLDVAGNELLSSLPDSVCKLWHLQTLLLHGCHQLKKLPDRIGKLRNLRYLTLTTSQETLQEEIGQLTSLRTLGLSSCQNLVSLPCGLKNLKKLQTLGIVDCPKVDLLDSSSVEALRGMDDIDTLLLSGLPEFEVLPPNLGTPSLVMKHLLIQFSIKLSETAWLNQFLSLHSLTVENCPHLSTLMVDDIYQFTNMTELVVRSCPQLRDTKWVRQFVSLRSLIIDGCPNLVALDAAFTELKKLEWLEIRRCPKLIKSITEDSSYIYHVRQVELDGVPLNRPSDSKDSTQEDGSNRNSVMDVASSSNHVISNSLSVSEISEDVS